VPGYSHPRLAALDYSSLKLSKEVTAKRRCRLREIQHAIMLHGS
jgi:hypothetical protein